MPERERTASVRAWCERRLAELRAAKGSAPPRAHAQEVMVLAHFARLDPDPMAFTAALQSLIENAHRRGRQHLRWAAMKTLEDWEATGGAGRLG